MIPVTSSAKKRLARLLCSYNSNAKNLNEQELNEYLKYKGSQDFYVVVRSNGDCAFEVKGQVVDLFKESEEESAVSYGIQSFLRDDIEADIPIKFSASYPLAGYLNADVLNSLYTLNICDGTFGGSPCLEVVFTFKYGYLESRQYKSHRLRNTYIQNTDKKCGSLELIKLCLIQSFGDKDLHIYNDENGDLIVRSLSTGKILSVNGRISPSSNITDSSIKYLIDWLNCLSMYKIKDVIIITPSIRGSFTASVMQSIDIRDASDFDEYTLLLT